MFHPEVATFVTYKNNFIPDVQHIPYSFIVQQQTLKLASKGEKKFIQRFQISDPDIDSKKIILKTSSNLIRNRDYSLPM